MQLKFRGDRNLIKGAGNDLSIAAFLRVLVLGSVIQLLTGCGGNIQTKAGMATSTAPDGSKLTLAES